MTDISELVKRLLDYREFSEGSAGASWDEVPECLEAATALEAQAAEIARLREAATDAERVMSKYIYSKPDVPPDHPFAVLTRLRAALRDGEAG